MTKRLCAVQQLVIAVGLAGAGASAVFAQTGPTPGLVVPSFADLSITTRTAISASPMRTTTTLYLSGARERRESAVGPGSGPAAARHASILQCDQHRAIHLNLDARLFAVAPLVEWSNTRGCTNVARG